MESNRHLVTFTHDEWSALAKNAPLPLTHTDVRHLKALGDPIDLAEADAIYRPLSALLQMYAQEIGDLHRKTSDFLGLREQRTPFVIGIAGSVAVGKSTTARLLQELLRRWPYTPRVDLVTTDGFLYPNAVLEERSLMDRKGFPESYDHAALLDFLRRVKSGEDRVEVPRYDHVIYDIVPGQHQVVAHPDILILEGLNVLQPPLLAAGWPNRNAGDGTAAGKRADSRPGAPARVTPTDAAFYTGTLTAVSDFFDVSIYVDASPEDLETWYLSRIFKLRDVAFNLPGAYFHQFADMPDAELRARSLDIWNAINLPNLLENIQPTRERADIMLCKGADHRVQRIHLRKL
ncbi:type I pantothenate kinase [Actinotignum timonense]|uniref:Pantothenate kinase n=1 Tax=Actinotignum timonense TaxID=1870995 RepID=A0ABU5GCG1_9ACTO|nr:type I pantothenate kinase [Actinotignum timonense]MDY5145892.1 type I pantothenate kinase [Actinotignum timonense]MDY5149505.1 type I pantothenate kinase [Actinotignum timonense]MDY5156363.1 type I pantothenate kinase [Actinotignum timonense]